MALARDELLQHYRTMHEAFLRAIYGLSDAELSEQTIDGWSVANHMAHLALWDDIRAEEVERISAGFESAWRMSGPQSEQFNPILAEIRNGLGVAQARWELERSHQRLVAALERASQRGLEPEHYGEAGLLSRHKEQHAGWIRQWRDSRPL